jgi:hypothetical protein
MQMQYGITLQCIHPALFFLQILRTLSSNLNTAIANVLAAAETKACQDRGAI